MDHAKAHWDLVEAARVIYCTGFFITVSPDSIAAVASHCAENDKIFAMVSMGYRGYGWFMVVRVRCPHHVYQ